MRIAMYAGGYQHWGRFNPLDLYDESVTGRMVGGGETAVIRLSEEMVKQGHQVTVFYAVDKFGRYKGVDYVNPDLFVPILNNIEYDAVVSWESPDPLHFRFLGNPLRATAWQCNWCSHGVHSHIIDAYLTASEWHSDYLCSQDFAMDRTKCYAGLNGVDLFPFEQAVERVPGRVLYSSSPDRGLHHLLRMWPAIKEQVPEATLHVAYEFNRLDELEKEHPDIPTGDRVREIRKLREDLKPLGVTFTGALNKMALARETLAASCLAYTLDPIRPTEGFGMTVPDNLAAGTPVVTSTVDAFPELWAGGAVLLEAPKPENYDGWIGWITEILREGVTDERIKAGREIAERYTWDKVAARLVAYLEGVPKTR